MKIGIYGGSFNPPHLGHMAAAESAAKYLGLDELLLIPAGIPPHKMLSADAAGADDRLAMTRLMGEQIALDTGVKVTISDMEIARGGKSYTADTLRILHEQRPDDELWLLMGTDMFLTFQYWYKPDEIMRYAGLCAFGRTEKDGEELFAPQRKYLGQRFPGSRIVTMTLPNLVDVSSTELRARIPKRETDGLLAPAVLGYIYRKHLYGTNLDLKRLTLEDLRPIALSYLKAKRIPHVLGTEQTAKALAEKYGADVEKARFAALLHDSTKRLSMEEQLAMCEHYHIELDELEKKALKLLHAKTGAALARDVFGADGLLDRQKLGNIVFSDPAALEKLNTIIYAHLPRALEDTQFAIINGNFAISSGLKLSDAVLLEKTPDHYLNVVAVKTKDQGAQWAKDLEEAFRSQEFKQVVDKQFAGYAKPAFLQ